MIPIFRAIKIEGPRQLKFQHEERFRAFLGRFKVGTLLEVFVRRASKPRSIPQNRYYWGVVVDMLTEHIGWEPDAVHDALKEKFLSHRDQATGLLLIRSTTTLTVTEFKQYCAKIQRWAAEFLGLRIPDPNESIDWSDCEFYD